MRLLILALALTGCGGYDPSSLQSAQTATETATATGGTTDTAPSQPNAPAARQDVPTATSSSTTVEVTVKVQTGDAPAWVLVPDVRQLDDAQASAPAGYHLPSRSELVAAFDGGELAAFKAPGAVWTTTAADDTGDVWTMRLSDGLPEIQWAKSSFASLYARD